MKRKNIGVRKGTVVTVALAVLIFLTFLISLVFWSIYILDFPYQSLYDYGIEVEAELVEVYAHKLDDEGPDKYDYHLYYLYVSPEGYRYYDQAGGFYTTREKAEAQLGKKIIITIEPWEGGFSADIRKSELTVRNFKKDLILAIVFTMPLLGAIGMFINAYRKDRIDAKLRKNAKSAPAEITQVKGRPLRRITVRYINERGEAVNRKVYRLFSRKNAEFLESLDSVKILVYKKYVNVDAVKLIPKKKKA